MKKVLVLFVCIAVALCAMSACSKGASDKNAKETESTSEVMTTDKAVIKEADAINLIMSYSDEELGLTAKQRKKASFMVAGEGTKIDGKNYIEVVATVKKKHKDGDKVTYTFEHLGVYYISYDGKKVIRKDMESKEPKYIDMKIKAVPTTTAPAEESEKETTTKG